MIKNETISADRETNKLNKHFKTVITTPTLSYQYNLSNKILVKKKQTFHLQKN